MEPLTTIDLDALATTWEGYATELQAESDAALAEAGRVYAECAAALRSLLAKAVR